MNHPFGPPDPPPPADQWARPPSASAHRRRGLVEVWLLAMAVALLLVCGLMTVVIVLDSARPSASRTSADGTPAGGEPLATAPAEQQVTDRPPATEPATAPATEPAAAQPTAQGRPRTVLTEEGSGIKNTRRFTVDGDWELHYTFDCRAQFGGQGNFSVMVYTNGQLSGVAANRLAAEGSDVSPQYTGGDIYLAVNSTCTWTLKVVDLP